MKENDLKAEIARNNYTIPSLARAMRIGKKALYAKIGGKSQFKQEEIKSLKSVLSLSDAQVLDIFFAD